MSKKQLNAAQGLEAACILFEINSKTADIINMASGAQMPEEYLSGPGAEMFCAEWRAFVHAVVTAAVRQQAQCPDLFCQRLAVQAANLRGQASPPDDHAKARLAAIMAMVISAVWDKLEQYDIQPD